MSSPLWSINALFLDGIEYKTIVDNGLLWNYILECKGNVIRKHYQSRWSSLSNCVECDIEYEWNYLLDWNRLCEVGNSYLCCDGIGVRSGKTDGLSGNYKRDWPWKWKSWSSRTFIWWILNYHWTPNLVIFST